jgi:NADH dehydrogenase FAD-containing subunit
MKIVVIGGGWSGCATARSVRSPTSRRTASGSVYFEQHGC